MSAFQWDDPEVGYEPHQRAGYLGTADDLLKRMKEHRGAEPAEQASTAAESFLADLDSAA